MRRDGGVVVWGEGGDWPTSRSGYPREAVAGLSMCGLRQIGAWTPGVSDVWRSGNLGAHKVTSARHPGNFHERKLRAEGHRFINFVTAHDRDVRKCCVGAGGGGG